MWKAGTHQLGYHDKLRVVVQASADGRVIRQLETGSIVVTRGGVVDSMTKPELQAVALPPGSVMLNPKVGLKNTRQLSSDVIKALGG